MTSTPPPASLPSFDDIADDFAFIDDWDEKYIYIIDLGKQLPAFPEETRNEQTRVKGCASQVWLTIEQVDGKLNLRGDSDASIVKGLVAIVISLYHQQNMEMARSLNANEMLARLDLKDHITPQRSNGLASMLKRIEAFLDQSVDGS